MLVGGVVSMDNNYIYIPQKDNYLGGKMHIARQAFKLDLPGYYDEDYVFTDRYDPSPKRGHVDIRLMGPGAMYSVKGHAFAVQFSSRLVVSANQVPFDVAKFTYERRHYPELHGNSFVHNKAFSLGSASWSELGLTYARAFDNTRNLKISTGLTVKHLWSYHGLSMHSSQLEYQFLNSDSLEVFHFSGAVGISMPVGFQNNSLPGFKDVIQGKGKSFDAGITIIKKQKNGSYSRHRPRHEYFPYDFRLGISLVDIGKIQYNRNASLLSFEKVKGSWTGLDSLGIESTDHFIHEVLSTFDADNDIDQKQVFDLWLPASLSIQFDYNIDNRFYIHSYWIQGFRFSKHQLTIPPLLNISPRYENRYFELALPLTLLHYREVRAGLAFRAGFFTIGTGRLGALFGFNEFEGFDLYFSIKGSLSKKHFQKKHNRYNYCHSFF